MSQKYEVAMWELILQLYLKKRNWAIFLGAFWRKGGGEIVLPSAAAT